MSRRLSSKVDVQAAEFSPVEGRLLEVVAEHLVQLDEGAAVGAEPGCEASVQLRSRALRKRLVGGVADQEMAEAVAVFTGSCARSGRTS